MTNDSDSSSRSSGVTLADPPNERELDRAIARVREQFTSYEKLDRQIQDMIVRSADLLKGAVELRQRANQEVAQALGEIERQVVTERSQHQEELNSVVEDLAGTRQRAIQLAGAISSLQQQIGVITNRLGKQEAAAPTAPVPFSRKSAAPPAPQPEAAPISMLILVQAVPDGTTALSLQRYVSELEPVLRITSQEYAAGELRMQTLVSRPLTNEDFRGWHNGSLELAHSMADALVLRLGSSS